MIRKGAHAFGLVLACFLASCADSVPADAPPVAEAAKPDSAPPRTITRMNRQEAGSSISLDKFFALQQSGQALIFDARPAFFYHLDHIPGAISLPKDGCDAKIAARKAQIESALADEKTIVVYCSRLTCPDARTVAYHFAQAGYPATIFSAGMDAWKDASLPVE